MDWLRSVFNWKAFGSLRALLLSYNGENLPDKTYQTFLENLLKRMMET